MTNLQNVFIGEGARFEGVILHAKAAVISGELIGELNAEEIKITKSGSVSGLVAAKRVHIEGTATKMLICESLLTLASTAVVTGSVTYKEIEMAKGAELSGQLTQSG